MQSWPSAPLQDHTKLCMETSCYWAHVWSFLHSFLLVFLPGILAHEFSAAIPLPSAPTKGTAVLQVCAVTARDAGCQPHQDSPEKLHVTALRHWNLKNINILVDACPKPTQIPKNLFFFLSFSNTSQTFLAAERLCDCSIWTSHSQCFPLEEITPTH